MRRLAVLALAASAALNLLATLLGRGSFVHFVGAIGVAAYIGLPAFIAGTLFYALRSRYARARTIATLAWTVSVVALSVLISIWPGRRLAARDIAEAEAYCEMLATKLDAVRQQTGRYPVDLSALRGGSEGPRLVRESLGYSSDGGEFELTIDDPREPMNNLAFRSSDRRWLSWD